MISAINNFGDIEAMGNKPSFERLSAGGYVVKFSKVEAKTADNGKPYLQVVFDIAEGDKKGFFANTDDAHEYIHTAKIYYNEKALGMFKRFLKAVDESNKTKFCQDITTKGFDENKLVGKIVGGVVGYKEKINTRGETKQVAEWSFLKSVQDIRDGKFKTPELKKLEKEPEPSMSPVPGFAAVEDEDLPF